MSLTKCPDCQYENSWLDVYLALNLKHSFSGKIITCKNCKKKLIIKKSSLSPVQKILRGLVWMAFPLALIVAVFLGKMTALAAIIWVIMYHFVSFLGIIHFAHYSKTKK